MFNRWQIMTLSVALAAIALNAVTYRHCRCAQTAESEISAKAPQVTRQAGSSQPAVIPTIFSAMTFVDRNDPFKRKIAPSGTPDNYSAFYMQRDWYGENVLIELEPSRTIGKVWIAQESGSIIFDLSSKCGNYRIGIK